MTVERKFLEAIAVVRRAPFGKRVVHFFSSLAKADPDYTKKVDRASNLITRTMLNGPDSAFFILSSGDIVFICAQVSATVLGNLCTRLECEFFGTAEPPVNVYGERKYYKVFDAGRELSALINGVKNLLSATQVVNEPPPIGIKQYQDVVNILKNNDFRTAVFNQPVYSSAKTGGIEYIEFFVSMEQLRQLACPEHSIAGNAWLFNMIKAELDHQVMRIVAREIGEYRHKAFAINLLGATFLSKEFDSFMTSIPARLSGKIYVEIDRSDFLHHSNELDRLLKRSLDLNVPICIDGITLNDLRVFRPPFGAKFVKIRWSEEIGAMAAADLEVAVRALQECCSSEVVLSHCDSERSLAFAQALRIPYLQGRLADRLFRSGMAFTEAVM